MGKTPEWLPDGSSIDINTLERNMIVETIYGELNYANSWTPRTSPPIVKIFADVTPPKPDPRTEVLAQGLHDRYCLDGSCNGKLNNHAKSAIQVWFSEARTLIEILNKYESSKSE